MPWRGPAGEARHTGAAILLWEREGKALGVPGQSGTELSGSLSREAGQHRHPCTARSQPDGVRAQLCVSAHPAMREARVPAGQHKDTAPSRSAAGKSATIDNSRSIAAGRQDRPCVSDRHRQAEKPKVARWSEPAQTGWRNRARYGLARRRQHAHHGYNPMKPWSFACIVRSHHAAVRSWAIF